MDAVSLSLQFKVIDGMRFDLSYFIMVYLPLHIDHSSSLCYGFRHFFTPNASPEEGDDIFSLNVVISGFFGLLLVKLFYSFIKFFDYLESRLFSSCTSRSWIAPNVGQIQVIQAGVSRKFHPLRTLSPSFMLILTHLYSIFPMDSRDNLFKSKHPTTRKRWHCVYGHSLFQSSLL